ncbi:hypothetical protein C0995_001579 [Termitomyces sp. Mi166|nr:hypothetical protein C0995_001579 [Termitomyces sp. Mi166\
MLLKKEGRNLENWSSIPTVDPLANPLLFLYSKLTKKFAKKCLETSLTNLTSAAFHLGCLLKGLHSNPLYIALAVSPLMLLLPWEYAELASKDMLLKLWTHVRGLECPPAVVMAEKAIWQVIFNISLGRDVIKELKLAFGNVQDTMHKIVPQ